MSDIVSLESRRKPVRPTRYSVEIEHYADGKVTVFLEGLRETPHSRQQVSQILRHAAEIMVDNNPESPSR
jgi:hypothetical protein